MAKIEIRPDDITTDLCPRCIGPGFCWFNRQANEAAERVRKSRGKTQEKRAGIASRLIAGDRKRARDKTCNHINDVNPDYPGRDKH